MAQTVLAAAVVAAAALLDNRHGGSGMAALAATVRGRLAALVACLWLPVAMAPAVRWRRCLWNAGGGDGGNAPDYSGGGGGGGSERIEHRWQWRLLRRRRRWQAVRLTAATVRRA